MSHPTYIPLTKFHERHPDYPPYGTLRYWVFNADSNGFNKVIKRVGRRILIDEEAYFRWIDEQNSQPVLREG